MASEADENQFPVVIVHWADAHSGAEHWAALDTEDKAEFIVCSAGHLITQANGGKPGHLTIAQSHTPDLDFDHVLHIPNGMIRSCQILGPASENLHM